MPYVSNAQRRLFHAKEARGEISSATVDEFDQASKGMKLPERVGKKKLPGHIDTKKKRPGGRYQRRA